MRVLAFSDLHQDAAAARALVERARFADVLVGAGDFANMRRGVELCINVLKAVPLPAVLVPGNNESADELRAASKAWPSALVLHGTSCVIQGATFFGLGGGVPLTPFGPWSYDFTEHQAEYLLTSCPSGSVLVSHSPPKGILDRSSSGQSLGSTAVRAALDRLKPRAVVCGHIHASSGRKLAHGTTTVINAGPKGVEFVLA